MERHGFIRTELELKTLILFALRRAELPIAFEHLTDMVMCDDAIDYFEYVNCLNDLVTTGHVHREQKDMQEMYFISQKGRKNLEICLSNIPISVRERAENAVDRIMRSLLRLSSVKAKLIERDDNSLAVCCSLSDDCGEILSLELTVLTHEQGRTLARNFEHNAESIYNVLIKAMLDNGSI